MAVLVEKVLPFGALALLAGLGSWRPTSRTHLPLPPRAPRALLGTLLPTVRADGTPRGPGAPSLHEQFKGSMRRLGPRRREEACLGLPAILASLAVLVMAAAQFEGAEARLGPPVRAVRLVLTLSMAAVKGESAKGTQLR